MIFDGYDLAMRLTEILRTWNADRGFGFIAPTHGGPELFVHVKAFPQDGTHPSVGERLTYELGRGNDGKPRAVNVVRAAIGNKGRSSKARAERVPSKNSWLGSLLVLGLLVGGAYYGYTRFKAFQHRLALESSPVVRDTAPADIGAPGRHCDGRTWCSEMTSCAEAKWFINNCPGTRMDGNHDGTPCEQQWCTSPFAK